MDYFSNSSVRIQIKADCKKTRSSKREEQGKVRCNYACEAVLSRTNVVTGYNAAMYHYVVTAHEVNIQGCIVVIMVSMFFRKCVDSHKCVCCH